MYLNILNLRIFLYNELYLLSRRHTFSTQNCGLTDLTAVGEIEMTRRRRGHCKRKKGERYT